MAECIEGFTSREHETGLVGDPTPDVKHFPSSEWNGTKYSLSTYSQSFVVRDIAAYKLTSKYHSSCEHGRISIYHISGSGLEGGINDVIHTLQSKIPKAVIRRLRP